MAKLHIVGIGGTGHKVLQAAIHLAACGAFKGKVGAQDITKVRVMTIDADASNGNLNLTRETLAKYQAFCSAISGSKFCPVEIDKPLDLRLYDGEKNSIEKAFETAKFDEKNEKALLNFLYTEAEVKAQFNEGFYGHTSIGTLIVENMLNEKNKQWNDFVSNIDENDFVVIAGSIFGGTGASAIPVVLEKLNAQKEKNSFYLAAIILTPYFKAFGKINERGDLQPDSSKFQVKAKAGLYYYRKEERYNLTDALYIIGEPESNYSIEAASRGSTNQKNKAHPMELFAATGIVDFIAESKDREKNKIITADRDVEKEGERKHCYTWNMLQKAVGKNLSDAMKDFLRIAIFYNKILYNDIKHGNGPGIWQSLYDKGLDDGQKLHTVKDGGEFRFENIYRYFSLFVEWMYDLHQRKLEDRNEDGTLKSKPNENVRFFKTGDYQKLFKSDESGKSGKQVTNYALRGFDDLLYYKEQGAPKSEWIYAMLCGEKSNDKQGAFNRLFDKLSELVKTHETSASESNYEPEAYFSRKDGVTLTDRSSAQDGKMWAPPSDPDLLLDIAEGLPNTEGKSFTRNDLSIPSPWSIFIMNEFALTEEKFKLLHKDAFNQWCGLLALIALRKLNHYDGLKLEKLNYTDSDPVKAFVKAAGSTCTPKSSIGNKDAQDWTKCVKVSLDNETIAFLANNTLVCPVYAYEEKTKNKLRLIAPTIVDAEGKFQAPENYFSGESNRKHHKAKYGLCLFLRSLYKVLNKTEGDTGKLKELITAFSKALGDDLTKDEMNDKIPYYDTIGIQSGADKGVTSVELLFGEEDFDLCPTDTDKEESPFTLVGLRKEIEENVVLIGKNICGITPASPDADGIHLTDEVLYNEAAGGDFDGILKKVNGRKDKIRLVWDEKLLADSMVMIAKGDNYAFKDVLLPNNTAPAEYEVIWPVHEDLAKWFSMKDLNNMLTVTMTRNTVTVMLTLKIKGIDGKGENQQHIVQKKYSVVVDNTMSPGARKDNKTCMIFEKNRLPFWAVWPYDHRANDQNPNLWKRYNFFCIEREYQNQNNPVFTLEPFFEGGEKLEVGKQILDTVKGSGEVSYRRYEKLPGAFTVHEKTNTSPIYLGMVFLKIPNSELPKPKGYGGEEWNIGVDFGTTSTTAFYNTNNSEAKFINLLSEYEWVPGKEEPITKTKIENGNLQILCNSETARKEDMEAYFIDTQCFNQNGWITAWERMDTQDDTGHTMFKDGRIFWHNHKNFRRVSKNPEERKNLQTSLKWETGRKYADKYLNQLLTQIVYQAAQNEVGKINWFFSYPTAFSGDAQNAFSRTLAELLDGLENETGIKQIFNGKDSLLSESMAAAYYFKKQHNAKGVLLCVDIGGGTSDISLWNEDNAVFQSSVRFASRDMFVKPLQDLLKRDSVSDAVRTYNDADGINMMFNFHAKGGDSKSLKPEQINFFIETALVEYLPEFRKRLDSLTNVDLAAYKNFKYRVLIAYSGLMYYLAGIIAQLFIKGKIDERTPKIVLGLSGKGAKMTEWINAYTALIYGQAEERIKEKTQGRIEKKPGGIEIKLDDIFESKTAKTETAAGLVASVDRSGKLPKEVDPEIFMGASIELTEDGKESPIKLEEGEFVDTFTDERLKKVNWGNLEVDCDEKLSEMEDFIQFFNNISRKARGDIDPIDEGWWTQQKKYVWSDFKTEFKTMLPGKRFDPPFIVMLEVLLKKYGEHLADSRR